jgi:hypothetical protein
MRQQRIGVNTYFRAGGGFFSSHVFMLGHAVACSISMLRQSCRFSQAQNAAAVSQKLIATAINVLVTTLRAPGSLAWVSLLRAFPVIDGRTNQSSSQR